MVRAHGLLRGSHCRHHGGGSRVRRLRVVALVHVFGAVDRQELVEGEEATTHADLDVVLFDLHHDPLRTELIDSFRFAHEHDLEFLAVWVVINILSELFVRGIVLNGNVDGNARLQIDDVLVEHVDLVLRFVDFKLRVFQLLEHLELRRLRIVELLFELHDV